MNLGEGWEKKLLIVVAVVVFMLVAYAYNPFQSKTNQTVVNGSYVPPTTPTPVSQNSAVSNESNNLSNNTNNSFLISAEQAKKIAMRDNRGFTASEPMQGTIVVNQTTIAVWVITLSKSSQSSKTVYVDVNTGKIIDVN
ncbi:PepSY domain-containing protein [Methanobacterium formicicum]|jgi:hypothetical protein|uniref:PepSY domain-containing protein n=1 Tax=Methanobacterium formicicum TaxID=2162 RepID=A0A089ZI41_METFO|nr:PepSY domain-containing protein [Methanobacterium formicicum]AIS32203.1 hypothetical protein BRM9_1388 [Methanobacterium formicicum]MBF4475192.1 PepSY domain-containing protein [Methanobacterium formicicum]CEL24562.1 hypothetical protein MB9_0922 [Methanobacterium formicicum]